MGSFLFTLSLVEMIGMVELERSPPNLIIFSMLCTMYDTISYDTYHTEEVGILESNPTFAYCLHNMY